MCQTVQGVVCHVHINNVVSPLSSSQLPSLNFLFPSTPQPRCEGSTTLPMYWSAWDSLPKTPTSTHQEATTSLASTGWDPTLQTSHTYVSFCKFSKRAKSSHNCCSPSHCPSSNNTLGVRHREDADVLKDKRCGSKAIVAIQGRRHWCNTKHSLLNCYDIEGVALTEHIKDTLPYISLCIRRSSHFARVNCH